MKHTALAIALILAGTGAASAQGYGNYGGYGGGHYGPGAYRQGPVVVIPHRHVFVPPHPHRWQGYHRFHRHPGWHRRWGW